jgi:hypothetical protein
VAVGLGVAVKPFSCIRQRPGLKPVECTLSAGEFGNVVGRGQRFRS